MCFPCRFIFLQKIFLPLLNFYVSFCVCFKKMTEKTVFFRYCVMKYLFAFCCLFILCYYICERKKILRHYAKELFASLYERIICVIIRKNYLRHYTKELFASLYERIICVIIRKNYLRHYAKELFAFVLLRSQHSLDIFIGQEQNAGLCFWLPFYFYIEIKR